LIAYFDTSAFVPLLIAEPSSDSCRRIWDDADAVATSRLLFVEAAAALAQARRMDRLNNDGHTMALRLLERLWVEFDIVEADDIVISSAARLADTCGLRGYDAVHCASADQLQDPDLVVACGDRRLLQACRDIGMATADISRVE
jgi:predicted nucleic acid-binding protein